MNALEREIARISNLKNFKELSQEQLEYIAQKNLIIRDFKNTPIFDNQEEQHLAEEKFHNYIEANELESSSDIDTLKSLVYNEVFEVRIQKELNKLYKEQKYPPEKLTNQLVDVQNQKSDLKVKLGIDKAEDDKDEFSAYQLLQKRVEKHINDNRGDYTLGLGWTCEKCGHKEWETFLLYLKVKDYDIIKHPWFCGRYLFNYEIVTDVKKKKLSPEDATRYLMCSGSGKFYQPSDEAKKWCLDFINYCVENYTEISSLLIKQ